MRQGSTRLSLTAVASLVFVLGPVMRAHADTESTPASLPDERLGYRTAPLLLLSRPDVRADLGLTVKQAGDAEAELSSLYPRAAGLRGKVGEQAERMRKAIDEEQKAWFESNLTAEQRSRLFQIDLQWEGPSALVSRPKVADTLGLSTEQRASLKQAVAARDSARAGAGTGGPTTTEHTLAKQALAVLTQEQQDRWRAILGRPFVPRLSASGNGPKAAH